MFVIVEGFPEADPDVEQAEAAAEASDETGCHQRAQPGVREQQIVVALRQAGWGQDDRLGRKLDRGTRSPGEDRQSARRTDEDTPPSMGERSGRLKKHRDLVARSATPRASRRPLKGREK